MNKEINEVLKDDTENGGTKITIVYFDSNGKVCSKQDAVRAILEESDKSGNILQTTYCKIRK